MNFQKLKNIIHQNIILFCIVFINVLFILPIYYKYQSNGNIFIFLFISFEIFILYFIIISKFNMSSFSIDNEVKILKYDESKYNKLVDLRLSFVKSVYGFISTFIFSGFLFQSNLFNKIIDLKFVNVSFIFFILSSFGKCLCQYYLDQIKVYENFLGCDIFFENMPIIYLGKLLITVIMCMSFIFLTGLFLLEI